LFFIFAAKFQNCKKGLISFIYTGLSVEANPRKGKTWDLVVVANEKRLGGCLGGIYMLAWVEE
jgi:hypothetical protein